MEVRDEGHSKGKREEGLLGGNLGVDDENGRMLRFRGELLWPGPTGTREEADGERTRGGESLFVTAELPRNLWVLLGTE